MSSISLASALTCYVARRVNLRASSAEQLRFSVAALNRCAGRSLTVQEVSADRLCEFMRARLDSGCAVETVRRDRRNVLTVLRWAHEQGWIASVSGVPTLTPERRTPSAWTMAELSRLLAAADAMSGRMRGLPIDRRWWFRGLILFLYDTGARLTSALSLRTEDVWIDRRAARLRAATDKNHREQVFALSDQTIDVLREGLTERPLVFPYPWSKRKIWRDLKALEKAAGLPTGREHGFHRFRRTHATQAVIVAGWAAAQRSLGHSSEQMTRVYVDQTQVQAASNIDLPRPVF